MKKKKNFAQIAQKITEATGKKAFIVRTLYYYMTVVIMITDMITRCYRAYVHKKKLIYLKGHRIMSYNYWFYGKSLHNKSQSEKASRVIYLHTNPKNVKRPNLFIRSLTQVK